VVHNSPTADGWIVVESEDNYPINIMEDGVMVPVVVE